MLWLKLGLGYCVLVGVGLWLGYRSRKAWPSDDPSGLEVAGPKGPIEPRTGATTGLR
jgi:hypothetical protein